MLLCDKYKACHNKTLIIAGIFFTFHTSGAKDYVDLVT